MELATNLALIHRTLVKDSRVNSGLDVYNFGTFCDVSEEEMEKMNPFFEIQQKLIGLDGAAYEFDMSLYEAYEHYKDIERRLRKTMEELP